MAVNTNSTTLDHASRFHLDAAEGWLGLGDWKSARDELAQIPRSLQECLEVLLVWRKIFHATHDWESLIEVNKTLLDRLPELDVAWIDRSYALHELKRTQEAFDALLPAVKKFPDQWLIRYNLACYCSQLGRQEEALAWLREAAGMADKKEIKAMALEDPDLSPLCKEIRQL